MDTTLNEKLKKKLEETGLTVHGLEKKAGLKRSAVQNILHGRSKKPSAEILFAIAKVFGCSIRELLDKNAPSVQYDGHTPIIITPIETDKYFQPALYSKTASIAEELFKKYRGRYVQHTALKFISEVYHYSLSNNHKKIDKCFAEWLFKKYFCAK